MPATVSIKISNFFFFFCSFDLSCPILEKIILSKMCILHCLVFLKLVKNESRFMCFRSLDNVTV